MQNAQDNLSGFGIDLCDIERINSLFKQHDANTLEYLFNYNEYLSCINHSNPDYAFASFFALKEAFGKATGFGMAEMSWRDIEITNNSSSKYSMTFKGKAMDLINTMNIKKVTCTIQEKEKRFVLATVVLEQRGLE